MKKFLQQTPLFLFLLPVFFVLHGYSENFGYINLTDCLVLMVTYSGAAAFIYFIFLFIFKDNTKAALIATFLMAFYCFFGAIHDFLKAHLPVIDKLSILLSSFVIIVVLLFFFLKRTKNTLFKASLFINLLLLVYIILDITSVIRKSRGPQVNKLSVYSFAKNNSYDSCKGCPKPDIYFLLFDEYASSVSLKQKYNFNNDGLDSFLMSRGFHIQTHSRGNYNFTPFSMSSILNMSYLNGIHEQQVCTAEDYANCNDLIRNNEVIKFLSFQGYDIINYSVFDLAGNPSRVEQTFLPLKTKLITDRTLFSQIQQQVNQVMYGKEWDVKWFTNSTLLKHLGNNNKFLELTEKASEVKSTRPRFIYMHVYMPHPPYFFDKNGNQKSDATIFKENSESSLQPYLDYLPYANKRIKEIISAIEKNTDGNAVIIFMADHGFRYPSSDKHPLNHFQNQNAIYFPGRDYHLLYDSISGVNQFRIVFNQLFNQKIPLLKDSTIFLR